MAPCVIRGSNQAVASNFYLLGWSRNPADVKVAPSAQPDRSRILLWHANYHPDGGQLFFPLNGESFVCPLALPGDLLILPALLRVPHAG